MPSSLTPTELFLSAMLVIFTLPWLLWRLGRTEAFAPLVVVQIVAGVVLGPGLLGRWLPEVYGSLFAPPVVQALNGLAWWAVILFVWIAGLELDLRQAWRHRRESLVTAGLALGTPLLAGAGVGALLLLQPGWMGAAARPWQFVAGIGMSCAVTALPILILFMEKLQILRQPLGQRILRYASLDDIAVWGVLALILADWQRVGHQVLFLALFGLAAWGLRRLFTRLAEPDRWAVGLVWLLLCALGADLSGLHFMVGAFLAGAVIDADAYTLQTLEKLRHHVLLVLMPVFFLSTGLRTNWALGGSAVLLAAALLLLAAVGGKLAGLHLAGRVLRWRPGEAGLIGWLLQTKALIMIIFVGILLDRQIISAASFTALLLMAVASTMLTVPFAAPRLRRLYPPGPDATAATAGASPTARSAAASAASSSAARTDAPR